MSKHNFMPTRYETIDLKTNTVVDRSTISNATLAVAQHYRYVRCVRRALIGAFQIAGGKRSQVFIWLLKHSTYTHRFVGSQRKLAKKMNVSYPILHYVLNALQKRNLAIVITGSFIISPKLFFYGNDTAFMKAMHVYKLKYKKYKGTTQFKSHPVKNLDNVPNYLNSKSPKVKKLMKTIKIQQLKHDLKLDDQRKALDNQRKLAHLTALQKIEAEQR